MAYIVSSLSTKNISFRRLASLGGIMPDLDGVFLLWDINAFRTYHHAIFHPLLGGAFLGAIFATAFWLYGKNKGDAKADMGKYFAFFLLGVLVHDFGDIIGTSWPIMLLYPLPTEFSIYPLVSDSVIYGVITPVFSVVFISAALIQPLLEGRSVLSVLSERIDKKFVDAFYGLRRLP